MDNLTFNAAQMPRLVAAPIKPECIATVVLPVRDEESHLSANLESLAHQTDTRGRLFRPELFEIIIFANNCSDRSANIARLWRRKNQRLTIHVVEADICPENSNIGFVRKWMMDEAYRRLIKNNRGGGVILTTDADTRVAPDWLAANLLEIKNGADAVGGRILISAEELKKMPSAARRFHLYDTVYRLLATEVEACLDFIAHDFLPRHHQHFNASFAVTTEAYRRAGGVPPVRFLEDVALYHALLRVDARFRHSPLVRVWTSGRECGRTEAGLSTQIKEWRLLGANGDHHYVESAASIKERAAQRKILRDFWECSRYTKVFAPRIARLADGLLIAKDFLAEELNEPQTFGSLYEKIIVEQSKIGAWLEKFPHVEVEQARFDLRNAARQLRIERAAAACT